MADFQEKSLVKRKEVNAPSLQANKLVKGNEPTVKEDQVRVKCDHHYSDTYRDWSPGVYFVSAKEGAHVVARDCEKKKATEAPAVVCTEEVVVVLSNKLVLCGKAWGARDDEASHRILSLHGWLDNSGSFDLLAPKLVQGVPGLRMLCLDLPGHGRSAHRSPDAAYLNAYMVRDVCLALHELGWEKFTFLSHSMGAAVSAMVSALLSNQIEQAIFLDHLGHSTFPPENTLQALGASLQNEMASQSRKVKGTRVYQSVDEIAKVMCSRNPYLKFESARHIVCRGSWSADPHPGCILIHDPRLRARAIMQFSEDEIRCALSSITAPVLMVWAEKRNYTLNEDRLRERESCISNLTKVHIPGSTHHLHLDNVDQVVVPILSFLRKNWSSPSET